MSKYLLPLLLLVGCQTQPETVEPVDAHLLQLISDDDLETQVIVQMTATSMPNNRWWGAGDTWWSMHEQRLFRRPIATEESQRWLREWLNRGED